MKSTKTFLLFFIFVMVVIIFSFQTFYQINGFQSVSRENVEVILKTKAQKEAGILSAKLNSIGEKAASLAVAISFMKELDSSILKETIDKELKSSDLVFGMGYWMEPYYHSSTEKFYGPYIYKKNNEAIAFTWKYSNEQYNYFNKDWYIRGLQKEKRVVYTSPYYDEILNTTFLTCSSPIIKHEKVIGVATADITMREIRDYISGMIVLNRGYAYIVTPEGYYWGKGQDSLADFKTRITDEDNIKLRELGRHIVETRESGIDTAAKPDEIIAWAPVGDTGLKLVMHYPEEEYFEAIRSIILKGIVGFIFAVGFFIVILNIILKVKIEEPLKKIISETSSVLSKDNEEVHDNLDKSVKAIDDVPMEEELQVDLQQKIMESHNEIHNNIAASTGSIDSKASFDNMLRFIRILFEERNRHIEELHKKGIEISGQKEEITALYEETTAMNSELFNMVGKIENAYMDTVRALSNAIEANDKYTKGHCEKVASYAINTGIIIGLSDRELKTLEYAALLHDIGKIGIPNHILNKPGSLTKEEFDLMKEHPRIGFDILKDIEFLSDCVKVIYQHHERPDGKGYPEGIEDDGILILSKIVSVADAFDSMTRARSYRSEPYSIEEACSILIENSGTQFSSKVVEYFLEMLERQGLVNKEKITAFRKNVSC